MGISREMASGRQHSAHGDPYYCGGRVVARGLMTKSLVLEINSRLSQPFGFILNPREVCL